MLSVRHSSRYSGHFGEITDSPCSQRAHGKGWSLMELRHHFEEAFYGSPSSQLAPLVHCVHPWPQSLHIWVACVLEVLPIWTLRCSQTETQASCCITRAKHASCHRSSTQQMYAKLIDEELTILSILWKWPMRLKDIGVRINCSFISWGRTQNSGVLENKRRNILALGGHRIHARICSHCIRAFHFRVTWNTITS